MTHKQPPRILITRLSAHGDVVQTIPLLVALRKRFPAAWIGWLVESSAAPLLEGHPMLDQLHVCDRKQWLQQLKNPLRWPQIWVEVWQLLQELKQTKYQASLDVQGLFKSAIWPWLAGIPERFGNDQAREQASFFYNRKLPPHEMMVTTIPAVQKFLEFATVFGDPTLPAIEFALPPVSPQVQEKVAGLLQPLKAGQPVVALAPATRWTSKHWPVRYWQQVLAQLQRQGCQILMLGSKQDAPLIQEMLLGLTSWDGVLDLSGKTGWTDLYALFEYVDILIGPDSAPLHIANAVGHPKIIGLFGPTAPGRTGPLGPQHRTAQTTLSCQPCFKKTCPLKTQACMEMLLPEQVLTLVEQQLMALETVP